MIYFCADDYGISKGTNLRIEQCLNSGVLNKVSVLPNGEIKGFKQCLQEKNAKISLHINLVEGYPLSEAKEIPMLVTEKGCFKYSFIGLFLRSIINKRKLEEQLQIEMRKQIRFWKEQMGEDTPVSLDSHQHTHMIPLIFKTLLHVIEEENVNVEYLRFPTEPIAPYILNPSLYFSYSIAGILKQWLLNLLGWINQKKMKKTQIPYKYFVGIMFSGKLTERKIKTILPHYLKLAERDKKDIEITFHPGQLEEDETLLAGHRASFEKFYKSPWREREFQTLINLKLD